MELRAIWLATVMRRILAEKISFYLTEPGLITKHGQAAREFIRGLEFGRQIDLIVTDC